MMTRDGSRHPANADSSDISVVGKVQQNIWLRGRDISSPAAPTQSSAFAGRRLIRPAAPAFRSEMISRRTRATHGHRMAPSTRTTPPAGSASFRHFDNQALIAADGRRRDAGIGGSGKAKSQGRAEHNRSNHYAFLPICWLPPSPER
jgi:hypothetical protein